MCIRDSYEALQTCGNQRPREFRWHTISANFRAKLQTPCGVARFRPLARWTRYRPKSNAEREVKTVGLRFQRRIRVFPGVHLNLSRSGVGVSVGGRGAHIGVTARGQRYTSVGLPGTGISWREYQHKPSAPHVAVPTPPAPRCELCQPGHVHIDIGRLFSWLGGRP